MGGYIYVRTSTSFRLFPFSIMRYLLNIGNTHTQVGTQDAGGPRLLSVYETPSVTASGQLQALDDAPDGWTALASCVVPAARAALQATYGNRIRFLTAADFPSLDFSAIDISTLGIDRICNASAALAAVGHGPVAAFDFGTCIASVTIDRENHFIGGVIAAGRRLLRHAMHEHTAQLPMLPLQQELPQPIGNTTATAMLAGTDLGVIGTARLLISETRRALNAPDCTIFATGGDAPYFLRHLPELTPAPSLLTLRGILTAQPNE